MGWTLDRARKIWKCDKYSDLNYAEIINLAEYGQPKSPYEAGFDHDFEPDFGKVIVEMTQVEVMTNGYGRNIKAESFPIVDRFLNGNLARLPCGIFDFDGLVRTGFAARGDRWIRSNLYGWGGYGIDSGSIDSGDAAFIHGTVSFALMRGTRFTYGGGLRRVEAEIGAGDDNWDFNSSSIPDVVNATVAALFGPDHDNLEAPIQIRFSGPGKRSVVEKKT